MLVREITRCVLASIVHRLNTVKVGQRITNSRLATSICGEGPVIARLRYGALAIVFANEDSGRAMYLWGDIDPRISAIIKAVLRKGDTAFDIGANFGVTGLLAAKCVGATGCVHLFEPQLDVAQYLRTSLLINGYSHAIVHECALSDRTGSAAMTIFASTDTSTATLSHRDSPMSGYKPFKSFVVRIENAADYVAKLGCSQVALIKIDVEGHEPVILASLRDWFAKVRPPVVLFECHLNGRGFGSHDTSRILSGLEYQLYCVDTRPYWRTRLYSPSEDRPPVGRDFVAVHWQDLDAGRNSALRALIH